MTKPYESGELFRSSKFLVFANRFLALFAAYVGLLASGEPIGRAARSTPLYKFSFSSVSNILSSVCQYEALKFVSFPTQVRRARAFLSPRARSPPTRRRERASSAGARKVLQDGAGDAHGLRGE